MAEGGVRSDGTPLGGAAGNAAAARDLAMAATIYQAIGPGQAVYSSFSTHHARVPGTNAVTPAGPSSTPRIRLLKPQVVL